MQSSGDTEKKQGELIVKMFIKKKERERDKNKESNACTYLVGGESKRDRGNAREGEEWVSSAVLIQGLQTGRWKENLFECSFSDHQQILAHTRRGRKYTARSQLTNLHVCFPFAILILREETCFTVWKFYLEEGVINLELCSLNCRPVFH